MIENLRNIFLFWFFGILLIFFWYFKQLIISFFIGIIIGLSIQTLAFFLNYKLRLNYYFNVFIIYTLLIIIITLVFYLSSQVVIEQLPNLLPRLQPILKSFNINIDLKEINISEEIRKFFNLKINFFTDNINNFSDFFSNILSGITSIVLIFVVSIYTAFDKNFPQGFFAFFKKGEEYARLWRKIKQRISFWFLGQIILMLFIGITTYVVLGLILKINYAPFVALLSGFLEVIPILGPAVSLIVAAAITYLEKPDLIFFVIGFFLVLQQFENHFLVPLVMKRAIEIHPLLIIFGIFVGGKIGGILGIIMILPLFGVITEIYNHFSRSLKANLKIKDHKTLI